MATLGFTPVDFEVFKVDDFSERMQQIYAHVRPKLVRLGDELAPELRRNLHLDFFPHVAKHARRTVNPPPETWAAFGPSPGGYKRYGYLALCISGVGLHARVVVKSEADDRPAMARNLTAHAAQLIKEFKGSALSRYDRWDFARLPGDQRVDPGVDRHSRGECRQKDRRTRPRLRLESQGIAPARPRRAARRLPRTRPSLPDSARCLLDTIELHDSFLHIGVN